MELTPGDVAPHAARVYGQLLAAAVDAAASYAALVDHLTGEVARLQGELAAARGDGAGVSG